MGHCNDLDLGFANSVDECERESKETPDVAFRPGPVAIVRDRQSRGGRRGRALRAKADAAMELRAAYHPSASVASASAAGWKPTSTTCQGAATRSSHGLPGDRLYGPGLDLCEAAFDFLLPSGLDVRIHLVLKTLDKETCEGCPIRFSKVRSLAEQLAHEVMPEGYHGHESLGNRPLRWSPRHRCPTPFA